MKTILLILCALTILVGCGPDPYYGHAPSPAHTPTKRCGSVTRVFTVQESAGYNRGSRDQPHVVFYDTTAKRNEDVEVSFDELANTEVGDTVCYEFCTYENCQWHYHEQE